MRICVIGLGRLGLPWALLADRAGHEVRGLDVDGARVAAINSRTVSTQEPGVSALLADPGCALSASIDPAEALADTELSVVTVSTPSQVDGSFGLAAVLGAMETIACQARRLAPRHVVVLKSTVSPGATSGAVRAALEATGDLDTSCGVGLVHAPEFHAIGSIVRDITHPYQVILGGEEDWALSRAEQLHRSLAVQEIQVTRLDAEGAELAKLAGNSFRTMKVAFANSLAELCTAYGSDPKSVCAAVGVDPHIGHGFLSPGLPYGGPCFPRDNPALGAAATAVGLSPALPAAVEAANQRRFAELEGAALAAAPGPIGIVGVGFKLGSDELEGSPALELARRWQAAGREVLVYDPLVDVTGFAAAVSLATLIDRCAVVLLAAADERLAADLQAELAGRDRHVVVIDPWGAISRERREVLGAISPGLSHVAAD
jgi:UDPglucose 6-dehydrogenase